MLTFDPGFELVVSDDGARMTVLHELGRWEKIIEGSRESQLRERREEDDATYSDGKSDVRLDISSASDLKQQQDKKRESALSIFIRPWQGRVGKETRKLTVNITKCLDAILFRSD